MDSVELSTPRRKAGRPTDASGPTFRTIIQLTREQQEKARKLGKGYGVSAGIRRAIEEAEIKE